MQSGGGGGGQSRVHQKKFAAVAALGVAGDEPSYLHLARAIFHLNNKISASARAGKEEGGKGGGGAGVEGG